MTFLLEPEFWARWLGIVVIDLTLAGDNALVIALAVRTLPARKQFWGRVWGTAGAVVMRLVFIGLMTLLFRIPLLQLAGGLLLLWIASKLVRQGDESEGNARHGVSLLEAIWIIILADMAMSLDNVLAVAGAAGGDLVLVGFGISLSLPLVVWGSQILSRLMSRYRWIIWLGGAILGYVAGEMVLKDEMVARVLGGVAAGLHYPLPIALGVIMGMYGWWEARRTGDRESVAEKG